MESAGGAAGEEEDNFLENNYSRTSLESGTSGASPMFSRGVAASPSGDVTFTPARAGLARGRSVERSGGNPRSSSNPDRTNASMLVPTLTRRVQTHPPWGCTARILLADVWSCPYGDLSPRVSGGGFRLESAGMDEMCTSIV